MVSAPQPSLPQRVWAAGGTVSSDLLLSQFASVGLPRSVAVTDTLENVQRNWAGLSALASAGKLASVKLSNLGSAPLTLSAAALLSGKTLLSKLGSPSVVVADTVANVVANLGSLQANVARFKSLQLSDPSTTISLSQSQWQAAAAVFAKIPNGQYQVDLSGVSTANLSRVMSQRQVQSFSLTDTAANVQLNWNTLTSASARLRAVSLVGENSSFNLTDAQYTAGQGVLSGMRKPVTLSLSQVAASKVAERAGDTRVSSLRVEASAADISQNLAALQSANAKLREVKLSNPAASVQVSAQQLLDASPGFWSKFSSKTSFAVVDSAANIASNLARLQSQLGRISSLTVDDASRPTLTVTAAQYKAQGAVLAKLKGAALSVKFAGNYEEFDIKVKTDGSFSVTDALKRSAQTNTFKGVHFFEFNDFTAFGDTGDAQLNALLSGGSNFWWYASGAKVQAASAPLKAGVHGLDAGSAQHEISYGFMQKLPASASAQDRNGFQALNAAQKLAVQNAFDYLSSLINVRFVLDEAAGEGGADINFGVNDQWGSSGYANPPNGSGDHNVFLMLDKASVSSQALVPGQYGWHTLIHEIGHTLGLKHPGNYNATAGAMPAPFLPKALDNDRYTVMSYLSPTDAGDVKLTISPSAGQISRYEATAQTLYASTYMLYDIAALQFIYGAAPAPSAPQDTSLRFEKDWRGLQTQYFPNNGTLDFSQIERANVIDLRPGAYSSVNVLGPSLGAYLSSLPSLPASTMSYLKSNQTYLGFNNLGLAYGSQMDRVVGGQASDRIYVGTDSIEDQLTLDGGAGEDTVFLPGVATDWALNGETQGNTVANSARNLQTGIQVQLTQIEKIRFYNESTTPLTHSSMDLMA